MWIKSSSNLFQPWRVREYRYHRIHNVEKNFLITSAGERVVLVEIFRRTVQDMGIDAKVYTCDMEPGMASACRVSDGSVNDHFSVRSFKI